MSVGNICLIDWNLLRAIKQHSPIARKALTMIDDIDLTRYEILSQRSEVILYGIFSDKQIKKRRLDEASSICLVAIEDIFKANKYNRGKRTCADISLKKIQEIDENGRGFYQISIMIKIAKRSWLDQDQILKIKKVLDKNLKCLNSLEIKQDEKIGF